MRVDRARDRQASDLATRVQQLAGERRSPEAPGRTGADLAVGDVVDDRYQLVQQLPLGGMSVVFKAVDLLKREAGDADPVVAVKVLNAEIGRRPDALALLLRETRHTQSLAHPNVVTVYDFHRADGLLYVTMEFLEGSALDELLETEPLSETDARYVIGEVCRGLEYAHDNGVVHSDLKPGNVFITASGRVKILDFGIARATSEVLAEDARLEEFSAFTPMFASPEQMAGAEPAPADDVYALGCLAYTLLGGAHPFGVPGDVARDQALAPRKLDGLSSREWRALQGALEFDRGARLPDALAFQQQFFEPAGRRLRLVLMAGLAVSLTAAIGLAAYLSTVESPEDAIPVEVRAAAEAMVAEARERLPADEIGGREQLLEALSLNPYDDAGIELLAGEIRALLASSYGPDVSEGLGYLVTALNHGVIDSRVLGIADELATRSLALTEADLGPRELANLRAYACELKDINELEQRGAILAMLQERQLSCPDQR